MNTTSSSWAQTRFFFFSFFSFFWIKFFNVEQYWLSRRGPLNNVDDDIEYLPESLFISFSSSFFFLVQKYCRRTCRSCIIHIWFVFQFKILFCLLFFLSTNHPFGSGFFPLFFSFQFVGWFFQFLSVFECCLRFLFEGQSHTHTHTIRTPTYHRQIQPVFWY